MKELHDKQTVKFKKNWSAVQGLQGAMEGLKLTNKAAKKYQHQQQ